MIRGNVNLTEQLSGADYVLDTQKYPGYHLRLAVAGFGFYSKDDEGILAVDLNTKEILSDKDSLAVYKETMYGIVNDTMSYQYGDDHIMLQGKKYDKYSTSDLEKSIKLADVVKHNQERLAKLQPKEQPEKNQAVR